MANRTDPVAKSVHGTNPQFLIGKIIRSKIYDDKYWKQYCFGLTAESLIDQAVRLTHIGGTYGGSRRPTPFLCLMCKLLQIQPSRDIVDEYIRNEDFKYLRALGLFYLRLTGEATDVYKTLEDLLTDYRKLRYRRTDGKIEIIHMDEFIDRCLRDHTVLELDMPLLLKRHVLEANGMLKPRESLLQDELELN